MFENLDDPRKQALLMAAAGLLSPVRGKGWSGFGEALSQGIQGGLLGLNQGQVRQAKLAEERQQQQMREMAMARQNAEMEAQKYMGQGVQKFMNPGTPSVPYNDSLGTGGANPIPGQAPSFDQSGFASYLAQNPATAAQALQFMPKPQAPITLKEGESVFDPTTGLRKFGNEKKDKPLYQPGQTRELKAGRTILTQQWDGSKWETISRSAMDKPEGEQKPVYSPEAGGFIYPPKSGSGHTFVPVPGITKPEKPLTESQAKAAVFLGQMTSANKLINDLGANGFSGSGAQQAPLAMASSGMNAEGTIEKIMSSVANAAAGKDAQKYVQAQEQWSEAFLRFKTGAASTPSEVQRNIRTFFPQPGDTDAVIAQKAEMRKNAEADIALAAGSGAKHIPQPMSMKPADNGWGIRRLP